MAGELSPCGTWGAYQRHVKADEPIDAACAEACRRQSADRYVPVSPDPQPCEWCGARFTPRRAPSSNPTRTPKYCSAACRDRARYLRGKEETDHDR